MPMSKMSGFLLAAALAGCAGSQGSAAVGGEVVETNTKLDLPPVPEFVAPPVNADGTHAVLEMRRNSAKYLDQPVKLKGFVIFKYDCIRALGEKVYKDTPDKCERPHFYLADKNDASTQRPIWVVEVPRAPREDEKKVLPKEELNDPNLWPPEPVYAEGDEVVVDGTWATKSPKGFVDSDGILIFKGMTVVTPAAPPPGQPAAAPAEEPKGKKKGKKGR